MSSSSGSGPGAALPLDGAPEPNSFTPAQFGAWREGVRNGAPPDCMHDVAGKIPADDIRAIAVYLSQQSNVDGVRPSPPGSFVPPRACGSLPHAQETK